MTTFQKKSTATFRADKRGESRPSFKKEEQKSERKFGKTSEKPPRPTSKPLTQRIAKKVEKTTASEVASQEKKAKVVGEKLQKILARAGQGSRRELEEIIAAGRVSVDGKMATLGDRVQVSSSTKIRIDGHLVNLMPAQKRSAVY